MKLSDVIADKGSEIISVLDNSVVADAVRLMCEKRVGSVIVRTMAGSVIGFVDERRIVEQLASDRYNLLRRQVSEIMLSPAPTISAQCSLKLGLREMTNRRTRHLVVVDEGVAIGVTSLGDLVNAHIRDLELENAVLRDIAAPTMILRD